MRRAFTLVELLVVIAIIALLLGVLLSALNKARQAAKIVVCASQMRQIGIAVVIYTQENNSSLPGSSHSAATFGGLRWGQALMPYLGCNSFKGTDTPEWKKIFNGLYRCPADRRRNKAQSYGKNIWFELTNYETGEVLGIASGPTYWKITEIPHPAATVAFGELTTDSMTGSSAADHVMAHFWLMGAQPEIDTVRHGKMPNFIFLDGHVQKLTLSHTFEWDTRRNTCTHDNWNPATAQ